MLENKVSAFRTELNYPSESNIYIHRDILPRSDIYTELMYVSKMYYPTILS